MVFFFFWNFFLCSFNLWCLLLIITLYHQTKISIFFVFFGRWELSPIFFMCQQKKKKKKKKKPVVLISFYSLNLLFLFKVIFLFYYYYFLVFLLYLTKKINRMLDCKVHSKSLDFTS